jgi:hypothetical protein
VSICFTAILLLLVNILNSRTEEANVMATGFPNEPALDEDLLGVLEEEANDAKVGDNVCSGDILRR